MDLGRSSLEAVQLTTAVQLTVAKAPDPLDDHDPGHDRLRLQLVESKNTDSEKPAYRNTDCAHT